MKIRFSIPYAPGDVWAAVPFIRDFAEQRPDDQLFIDQPFGDILRGNPFAVPWDSSRHADLYLVFDFHPDFVRDDVRFFGSDPAASLAGEYYRFLERETGIRLEQRTTATEFWPDDFERKFSPFPSDLPLCVLNAGWKSDVPVKFWGWENFAAVVDALKDRVRFVQVGAGRRSVDFHRVIPGAVNLIGQTSIRELAVLVYHADFVLTGISQLHHIAGIQCYKPRHCITIAGAREPENWANSYRRDGVTWHWISRPTCRGNAPGCWQSECRNCPAMRSIHPDEIISIFKEHL